MADANVTELRPSPVTGEGRRKLKDTTAALRARRYRRKRKFVTAPVSSRPKVEAEKRKDIKAAVTVEHRSGRAIDVMAYMTAIGLASVAALFSIRGMVALFPGAPVLIIGMAIAMESAKLVTAGWLARRWRVTASIWRLVLVGLVAGLAINATGVYAQLVAAHIGERGAAQSAMEAQVTSLDVRIEVAVHNVADLDRRLGQIDTAIEEAARRGRTSAALSAMQGQRRARAAFASERNDAAAALATLKAERATVAAQGRQIETEAAPIRYVAELVGADTDSERAIRWLILIMTLTCDPLAIALTAAASARRNEIRRAF